MPGIIVNEDNSHFFATRPIEKMNEAGLRELVDNYSGQQVKQINFCANCMRVSYDSKVWDSCWGPNKGLMPNDLATDHEPGTFAGWVARHSKWITNAKKLHDSGINPYQFWMKYTRSKNISPWMSMRMNDVHSADHTENWIHSEFWRDNPQFQRVPYRKLDWFDRELDYGRPQVREHALKLIAEYLELFDMDGLELDWMRFPYHFRPGFETQDGQSLTEFHRQVREMADNAQKRWGHQIKIGVRVPAIPEHAAGLGLNAVRWAELQLVNTVVPTPFLSQDSDIPIALWRRLLGKNIQLAAGLELAVRSYPVAEHVFSDLAIVSANAANYLAQGADKIYLFNYMDSETAMRDLDEFAKVLDTAGQLKTATANPQRHVVTYTDTLPPGKPPSILLPIECKKEHPHLCSRLFLGKTNEISKAEIILGFAEQNAPQNLTVRINGSICQPSNNNHDYEITSTAKSRRAFNIDLAALHDGYNVVEVFNESDQPFTIVWLELLSLPTK